MVNNQAKVSVIFAALSDPTRRRILVRLANDREWPVAALAKPFRISPPAISRHLRVLEDARLIERRREGRCHMIRVCYEGMKPAQNWMAQCAANWDFRFNKLDTLLQKERGRGERHEI